MNAEPSNRGKTLALTGAFLQLGPLIGMAGSVIGMMQAFNTLSGPGISDPERLSGNIGVVLIATAIGLGLSVLGLVLIGIALFAYRYRGWWFFWFLVLYGGILLLWFPAGTILGVLILGFCLPRRREFLCPAPAHAPRVV